jgi:glycosyltransferase involved in cell wall biosynthesis
MSKLCRISVVIPCFNHGQFLPEAIESVESVKRDDIEMVIVDDGSTDDRTCQEITKLSARGMKVIRQENHGLGAARNAAVLASSGEFIFPLDADDRIRPDWIETAIEIMDSDPRVGIVYGDAQCFGTRLHRWMVGPFDTVRLLTWNFIHASALYRRSVWDQNRGYDSNMPVQGLEDWDFWLGALEHGWRFVHVPEVFFDYRQSDQSMIAGTFEFKDQIAEFIAKKHGPLYREAWLSMAKERRSRESDHQSLRWTLTNLGRLLKSRMRQQFHRSPESQRLNRSGT